MQTYAGSGSSWDGRREEGIGQRSGFGPLSFLLSLAGIGAGLLIALLTSGGNGLLAAMILVAIPAAVLGVRHPLAVFWLWLAVAPFLAETDGGLARRAFWVVHRGLPLLAVIAIIGERVLTPNRTRRLRFGLAEWSMLAFVVATFVSVLYTSANPTRATIVMYDRLVIPIFLFYLVRTSGLLNGRLDRLVPAATWLVITQSVIGVLSWALPSILPGAWLGRAGERTVGSLQLPGTYSTALIFGAIILVHHALSGTVTRRRAVLDLSVATFGFFMVFMTFSRASWLAGLIAGVGLLWLYPKQMTRVFGLAIPVLALVLGAGLLTEQSDYASARLGTTQTVSGRLPVMYAAVQMWKERPVFGFGYGNFELYDRKYQRSVNGFVPEEDRASHNVYLTIMAEQGTVGIVLFLIPAFVILGATRRAWPLMARDGFTGQRLVGILWFVLAGHVIVNNFANMKSTFGLGMWWVTLGLISMLVAHAHQNPQTPLPAKAKASS